MKSTLITLMLLCGAGAMAQAIGLELFAQGFSSPVEIVHAGTNRLYVVQQDGRIKMLEADGTTAATPFLNISSLITYSGEQGLLGLAFSPNYQTNGYFFINYINTDGDTVIARYSRSAANPDAADPNSAVILLTIDQPDTNHNGGCLRFGPDGYLYISMGDGGGAGDPNGNAQNTTVLLGKMLRIDVNNGTTYSIPPTNPFATNAGADEIWAYGLRNAWKFSFNRLNGDLWIADVGQAEVEEINKVSPTAAGLNYGWKCFEGSQVYDGSCPPGIYSMPFAQYTHAASGGCSITGGYAYTGSNYPALAGKYLFADYCNNKLGIVNPSGDLTWTPAFAGESFTTFGEDTAGELYIAGAGTGNIYKITDTTAGTGSFTAKTVTLHPNPAHDQVTVTLNNTALPAQATVYDLGGKRLIQTQLTQASGTINTSALQAGLYLLEVASPTGIVQQKLVVN